MNKNTFQKKKLLPLLTLFQLTLLTQFWSFVTTSRAPAVLKSKPTRSSEMNVAPDINNHLRSRDLFGSMIILNNRSKVRDDHEIRTIPLRMPFFDAWVSSCLRKKDSVLQIARDSKVENCTTQKKIDYLL